MQSNFAKQLNESRRDALQAYYLGYVAPTLPDVENQPVTTDDLYQYLLIDTEVGKEVETSQVAQAIASLQQYLYRIALNQEPGFNPMSPQDVASWREIDSQYARWSASQQVSDYPENYILPSTRQDKSHFFEELENSLNQNRLNADRVQDAVLSYLNEFEAVSNLLVINGCCSQIDFGGGTYYFIGRTAAEPHSYYWRSMDLSKNGGTAEYPQITPNCWNDWRAIDLPLNSRNVLSWTVRPVFFNNRLYVSWVERDPTPKKKSDGTNVTPEVHAYRVYYGYLRYDGTWSAPNTAELQEVKQEGGSSSVLPSGVLEIEEGTNFVLRKVDTVAIVDFSRGVLGGTRPEGNLFIGLFVYEGGQDKIPTQSAFLFCDTSFINIATTGDNVKPNFLVYRPGEQKNGIFYQSLQYSLQGKKYRIQSCEKKSSHTDSGIPSSWPGALAAPSVSIANDGLTLQVGANLGRCPDENRDGGVWKSLYVFPSTDQAPAGSTSNRTHYHLTAGDTNRSIKFSFDGSYYRFYDTKIKYDANCGNVDIPSGIYQYSTATLPTYMGTWYGWRLVTDSSHNIDFKGSTPTSKTLDLHGMVVGFYNKPATEIFFSIGPENGYWDSYHLTFGINKNANKVSVTYQFQHKLKVYTVQNGNEKSVVASNETAQRWVLQPTDHRAATHVISSEDYPNQGIITYHLRHEIVRTPSSGSAGSAYQTWSVQVELVSVDTPTQVPQLCTRYDSQQGNVQFITFNGVQAEDGGFALPDTRLNTTFVRELIRRANVSLGTLLHYTTQAMPQEPQLRVDSGAPEGRLQPMDFTSANGLYFWELFVHVPYLVATRFGDENQNTDAQHWLHYIFDPSAKDKATDAVTGLTPPDYWNVYPLCPLGEGAKVATASFLMRDALNPDAQAYANPVIYQKAVFMAYVRTLIATGDNEYRLLTPDGLTAARVFYDQARELMGPLPTVSMSSHWTPNTLEAIASQKHAAVRELEHEPGVQWLALPAQNLSLLSILDNPNFRPPLNTQLLTYWQMLEARLYNLRHSLTLDGKPLVLPLYATPADPLALLTQRAQAGSLGNSGNGASQVILPYRFQSLLPSAYRAIDMLSQFGNTLLSVLERGENAHQLELSQQHLVDLSNFTISLQQQELDALNADVDTLQAQKAIVEQRYQYYLDSYNDNISRAEQESMDLQNTASEMAVNEAAMYAVAGGLDMAPNVFGLANGGSRWGAAVQALSLGMSVERTAMEAKAGRLAQSESYRRRRDDWRLQYEQAQLESQAIDKQLQALAIRQKAAQTVIDQAYTQQAQQQAMLDFLSSRFTQASLYQWLASQLSALYYQAYDAVLSLCMNVQACWQYELGDFSTYWVPTNAWNDNYRGLLVGETLSLSLQRMESAYLSRNDRRLNITRTFSLKALLADKPNDFEKQKAQGKFEFTLSEQDFDTNYPGHYARCLQQVSVTLPTLTGPYQDVQALLTQTRSQTLLQPDIEGVRYMNNNQEGKGTHVVSNLRPSQQIALSSGIDDSGTFALLAQDGRYLPFEGTGAVSSWTLVFPRAVDETIDGRKLPADPAQQATLEALNDVLIQVQYTALDGGVSFANAVKQTLIPS